MIAANVLVFIVNFIMMIGVNKMANELDSVYQENLHLNELSAALIEIQENMTDYLKTKTSDALDNYYRSEQKYSSLLQELNDTVTDKDYDRMERSIKYMSEKYLLATSQAIEAKRGRNVQKYSDKHEEATLLNGYINAYIYSLNTEQFVSNSKNYNELSDAFRFFETVSMGVLLVVIFANACIIIALTGTIIKPIKTLSKLADEVAYGNFNVKLLEVRSRDEIGVVTNAFNEMVVNIRQYIERIRESVEVERALKERELLIESNLKDAQLKYLQAQINPHFLFNTLNAGMQLAMMEEAEKTYAYILNMSEFYRYNVRKENVVVTIEEEIMQVDHYIYILNVRFSGEILYEKHVDEQLLNVKMPSMILQPIVENCVNHGIREMEGKGKITLSVFTKENRVCISIRDNGIGMEPEIINRIIIGKTMGQKGYEATNGIGMDNVVGRLKLFFERDDVIKIYSEGNKMGTEVILYL